MKSLNLLVILLLYAFQGFAQSNLEDGLDKVDIFYDKYRPLSVVNSLIKTGILKVGDLNLVELQSDLSKVKQRRLPFFIRGGSGNTRFGAINYTVDPVGYTKVVVYGPETISAIKEDIFLNSLYLHEGLGALGYEDENYEVSSSLSLLSTRIGYEKEVLLKRLNEDSLFKSLNKTKRTDNKRYLGKGGVTTIGGGGDPLASQVKLSLLLKADRKKDCGLYDSATLVRVITYSIIRLSSTQGAPDYQVTRFAEGPVVIGYNGYQSAELQDHNFDLILKELCEIQPNH